MTIRAEEARRRSEQSLPNTEIVTHQIKFIDNLIEEAIAKGQKSIKLFYNMGKYYPDSEHKEAIYSHYEDHGYRIKDHENPDPGHPCSSAYTTLSWS